MAEFERKSLGEVLGERGYIRGPFGSAMVRSELQKEGIPVYEQQHAITGTREFRFFVSEEKFKELSRFQVRPNDLIISCSGTIGRVSIIQPNDPMGIISQALLILRPHLRDVLPEFLYYFLSTRMGQHALVQASHGSVQVNIAPRAVVEQIELPVPNLPEQRAITHILGKLDDKIELNRRMNETLEAVVQALFKSWFVDFDPVRAKADDRDPGLPKPLADLFPDSFEDSELGEIPKAWRVAPLSDCVDVARGLSYKGSGLSPDGLPMHNLNSIYEGGGYKHEGLKYYEGEHRPHHFVGAGDLIVANTEQGHDRLLIGYAAIVPAHFRAQSLFSHHIYRVRTKSSSELTPDYLCHLLNTSVMHDIVSGYANGTTVNMLPIDALQSPRVLRPPAHVVTAFSDIAKVARNRHEEMVEEGRTLAALRDELLPKLISGELRVNNFERFVTVT